MFHVRCTRGKSGCGARFMLRKHPLDYQRRKPKCPSCGSERIFLTDKEYRDSTQRRKVKGKIHVCSGYPFPHVKGTLRFCTEHALAGEEPTWEERCEYEQVIQTPRG